MKIRFLVGLFLTLGLLWPLFWAPYFSHHDDVQVIRLYEMDKCIKDGQIPCRWVPDLGGLYGYPIFNYYAPLPYYFGELIYLISLNLIFSSKVMFAVSFLGSFVFMYLLARKYWGELGGSLSAIFYSFAPYHALDFYIRGAMGEMWGLMFFPAILWTQTRLADSISLGNLILLGIFIAGLALSHNLSLMIFLPIILLSTIILFFKKKKGKFLLFSFFSFILGVLLSAFYLLPMILEKNLVHVDTTTYGYFGYTEHYKGFRELFIDRDWGWGSSIREVPNAEEEKISFQIGWIHILGWGLSLFAARALWKKNREFSLIIIVSSVVLFLAVFMIHPKSIFIWQILKPLKYLQFPWRIMMIVVFFISFVAGSSALILSEKRKNLFWLILIGLVVLANFSYFRPEKFIYVSDSELLKGENWDKQIKRSIFDYLPIFAKEPPAELATKRYEILTGVVKISDFKEGTNWFNFKADVDLHAIIRMSQYYFPDWKIFVDRKEINFQYKDNTLGLMTIILAPGDHFVEARLYDTPVRVISNLVSLVSVIFAILIIMTQIKRIRLWIDYYRKRIG